MTRRVFLLAVGLAAVGVMLHAAAQAPVRADADSMKRKVAAVMTRALVAPQVGKPVAPLRTAFTERELNAYLKYDTAGEIPAGVVNPQVTLLGDGNLAAQALVDLDTVRKSRPRGLLDPMAYLTGSVQVQLAGALRVVSGLATFQLDYATISGIHVPKALLQELVSYYSKSADTPQGVDLDKPFPMPARIRSVEIQRGAAIVIQ
jgi:hypothetical protein